MAGRRGSAWRLAFLAAVCAIGAPAGIGATPGGPVRPDGAFSPLPAAWEAHRGLPSVPVGVPRFVATPGPEAGPALVLGWLPYWTASSATLHLDRLTHLAYFGVQVAADGGLGDARHWATGELAPLVASARQAGVRVVLTLIGFEADVLDAVLADPGRRALLVAHVTDLVVAGNGDGVNVDFEGVPLARKADFVAFVAGLKASRDEALGVSHVSVATPAVDWKGAYDYDELARAADALVIMGYEYHWSGGSPGPVSPRTPSACWGPYALSWTLDDYDRWAGVDQRSRIALALPLYGHDWPVVDDAVPGVATGRAASPSFAACAEEGGRRGWRFDVDSTTPWYFIPESSRQVWCEDRGSLAAKIALAADRGLGGVAFWALGYEEALEDPWLALADGWPAPAFLPGADAGEAPDVAEPRDEPDAAAGEATAPDGLGDPGEGGDADVPAPDVVEAGLDSAGCVAGFHGGRGGLGVPAVALIAFAGLLALRRTGSRRGDAGRTAG